MSIVAIVQGVGVRLAPTAMGAGLLSAVVLSLTMSGTLSGVAVSINNHADVAASGSLVMQVQEAGSTVTCLSTDLGSVSTNASSCSSINEFGSPTAMVPGHLVTTTVTIKNVGSAPAGSFTLTPGTTCAQTNIGAQNSPATDLCAKLKLVIANTRTGQVVYSGTLAALAGAAAITITAPPAAGSLTTFTFGLTLASTADNTYQGLQATLPMTWAFST